MLPKIFENIVANAGDVGAGWSAAKKALGWVREQVEYTDWNFLQNRVETKINSIIEEGHSPAYPRATLTQMEDMITSGRWDNSWGNTGETLNVMDGGAATKEYIDITSYFTSDGEPRVLALDASTNKVDVFNPRTLALLDTSDAFTDDLPTGGSEVWVAESFFTDGVSVYVLFKNTYPNPDEWQIQAWALSDWSVKSGWAATGVASSDTGNGVGEIIWADDDHLAIVQNWVTVTAVTDDAIALHLLSDGTFVRGGAGDAPWGDSVEAQHACSDGTNVFFVGDGASEDYICSATIADLETGAGVANYPLTITGGSQGRITTAGSLIASAHNISTYVESDNMFFTHSLADADLQQFERGASQNGVGSEEFFIKRVNDIKFDGINIWILGKIDNSNSGSDDQTVLIKIDSAKLSMIDVSAGSVVGLNDIASGPFIINPEGATGQDNNEYTRMAWDGRDIWVNMEPRASQTYSGKLYRLPLAAWRS